MTKASDAGLRTLPSPVGAGSYGALSRPLTCLSNACGIGGPCAPRMPAKNAPVAQLDRALDYESRGQEFESLRARHLRYSKGLVGVCGFKQDSRSHAASLWLPTKNIENNPMQSSSSRR